MNTWQTAKQLRYLVLAETWPDAQAEKVVATCVVTGGLPEEVFADVPKPLVVLRPGPGRADGQNPNILYQPWTMLIVTSVAGGHHGEEALLGAGRGGGQGSSRGRGLLEVEEAVANAVGRLTGADGVNMGIRRTTSAGTSLLQDHGYAMWREYQLEAFCTRERQYHAPMNLAKAGNTLTWTLPPDRFDRYKIVVNKLAGATAPSSATDSSATAVALTTDLPTTVDDAHSVETTYAVWCAYDETHTGTPGQAQRYSSAARGSTLTVT